jgi:hypothetical protein
MTKVTVDNTTLEKLHNLGTALELCDASGKTLGFFHPVDDAGVRVSQSGRSPYSIEELQERRKQRTGDTLDKVLARLGKQ